MQEPITLTQFIIAVASASFATFLGSAAVELLKNFRRGRVARREYKTQLSIELEQLVKLIVRLKSEYKARRFFPLNILELLAGSLLHLDEHLKSLALIANGDLQRQVFEAIADCRLLVIEVNATESWPLEKGIDSAEVDGRRKQAKEDRPEKNVELSDMQRRLEELIKNLKSKS